MTTGDTLLGALRRLHDAARGTAVRDLAAERADWRVVEAFVRHGRATQGPGGDDVMQETLLAIARHVADFEGTEPGGAVAWCTRIASHKRIDLARARARRGQTAESRDGESAVDLLEGDDGRVIDERALTVLLEVIETAVAQHVETLALPAADKQLRRSQIRATLYRVMGTDTDELRAVLALEPGFGSDRLAKWVERGRPQLVTVLERLAWDHEGDARDVLFTLRDLVLTRRSDAGIARPERRKAPDRGGA